MSYVRRLLNLACLLLPWIFTASLFYLSLSGSSDFGGLTFFLMLAPVFNIFINEKVYNFSLGVILKAVFTVALIVAFTNYNHLFSFGRVIHLGIFTVSVITFFANTENLEHNRIVTALFFNGLMYYAYYVLALNEYLKYAIICLSINILCLFLVSYLDNLFIISSSRHCNAQPKATIKTMKDFADKTFKRYFGMLICILGIMTLGFYLSNFESDFTFETEELNLLTEEEISALNVFLERVQDNESEDFHFSYAVDEIPDNTGDEELLEAVDLMNIVIGLVLIGIALYLLQAVRSKAESDKSIDIDEETEFEDIDLEAPNFKISFGFKNEREIIRKIFEKKIRRYIKAGVLPPRRSQTANTICETINQVEDISVLNEIYHEARYSENEINKEMVRIVRQSLKK